MTLTEFLLARIADREMLARIASVDEVERLCRVMHDAYEAAAVDQGWETQERSRKPWPDVPEANKATMRAAVRALLADLAGPLSTHVLADGEILKIHRRAMDEDDEGNQFPSGCLECGDERPHGCLTLRTLALPYADHPDYRDEWRP